MPTLLQSNKKTLTVTDTSGNTLDSASVEVLRAGAVVEDTGSSIASGGGTDTVVLRHPGALKTGDICYVLPVANSQSGTLVTTQIIRLDSNPTFNTSTLKWDVTVTNNGSANWTPTASDRLVLQGGVAGHRVEFSDTSDNTDFDAETISPSSGMVQIWLKTAQSVDFVVTSGSDVRAVVDEDTRPDIFVDPRNFGLPEPGSSDDAYLAIQNALYFASRFNGGGIVYLPPGSYKCESKLIFPDKVSVFGAGKNASTLVLASNTSLGASGPGGSTVVDDVQYKDFAMRADGTTPPTGSMWDMTDFSNCTFTDVKLDAQGNDIRGFAVWSGGGGGGHNNTWFRCSAYNGAASTGEAFYCGTGATNNVAINCYTSYFGSALHSGTSGTQGNKILFSKIENWSASTASGDGAVVFGGIGYHESYGNTFDTGGDAHQILDAITVNKCKIGHNNYPTVSGSEVNVFGTDVADLDYHRTNDGVRSQFQEMAMVDRAATNDGSRWVTPMAMGGQKLILGDEYDSTSTTGNQFLLLMDAASNAFDYTSDPGSIVLSKAGQGGNVLFFKYNSTGANNWTSSFAWMAGEANSVASANTLALGDVGDFSFNVTGTTDIHNIQIPGVTDPKLLYGRALVIRFTDATPGDVHDDQNTNAGYVKTFDGTDYSPAQNDWIWLVAAYDAVNDTYYWQELMRR